MTVLKRRVLRPGAQMLVEQGYKKARGMHAKQREHPKQPMPPRKEKS